MSAEERIERQHIHVVDSYVFSNHPIHFAGMAMFIANDDDAAVQLRVEESTDGTDYNSVMISVSGSAPQLVLDMAGKSVDAILFTSTAPYVRVRLTNRSEKGVFIDCVEFPPKSRKAPLAHCESNSTK